MTRRDFAYRSLLIAGAASLALGLAACEEEGPAEKAGEKIDETIDDAGRAAEDATD